MPRLRQCQPCFAVEGVAFENRPTGKRKRSQPKLLLGSPATGCVETASDRLPYREPAQTPIHTRKVAVFRGRRKVQAKIRLSWAFARTGSWPVMVLRNQGLKQNVHASRTSGRVQPKKQVEASDYRPPPAVAGLRGKPRNGQGTIVLPLREMCRAARNELRRPKAWAGN